MAKFTIMDNGILIEREELDMYNMFHWDDFSRVVDFSEFILLYDKIKLSLVLPKDAMTDVSPSEVRDYIAERIYKK
ncbi:MAG: YcxB family protein [Lachnospiraceae bacterium]|nr:YcxB family protein [Lachnospiraceae bacterium]